MADSRITSTVAKNRAEEFGLDVWRHFVVPPTYDDIDPRKQLPTKPRIFIGGRGCGKTMLLRYLSHYSAFSKDRPFVPQDEVKHIGLYWRVDTHFASMMAKRQVEDQTWNAAFSHMVALLLSHEIINSLRSIAESRYEGVTLDDLRLVDFSSLSSYGISFSDGIESFGSTLAQLLRKFRSWVSNVGKVEEPIFLPGSDFLLSLIHLCKSHIPSLSESIFFVYVDEYENLIAYQQKLINTWLKHSEIPLIFNLAVKRNAFRIRQTIGNEALADVHDYRQIDLESHLVDENLFFELAAEILFYRVERVEGERSPVDREMLRDPDRLSERREPVYLRNLLRKADELFPGLSSDELAMRVFEDRSLYSKLEKRIQQALKTRASRLEPSRFLSSSHARASVVVPALLQRPRLTPSDVLKEFERYCHGKQSKFSPPTDWIHNNFVGCFLQLYEPHSRACPFYSGFRSFCKLSRGNIRHFLELCYKSLEFQEFGLPKQVSVDDQAEAARRASAVLLREVKGFGPRGYQLHTFVLRLGTLFRFAHERPSQSETEQSHFAITRGVDNLTEEDVDFLNEALKWSVLFEEKATKEKDRYQPESTEYILNPIYAPYFFITYRKKRRLELSIAELTTLIRGSVDEVSSLLQGYSTEWGIEPAMVSPSLFESRS